MGRFGSIWVDLGRFPIKNRSIWVDLGQFSSISPQSKVIINTLRYKSMINHIYIVSRIEYICADVEGKIDHKEDGLPSRLAASPNTKDH